MYLSTGFVPVIITPVASYACELMAWHIGRLTGMAMQSLRVAIRWKIARFGHAKPWHRAVMASWLAVRWLGMIRKTLNLNCPRSDLSQISALRFFSWGPARTPREAPCRGPFTFAVNLIQTKFSITYEEPIHGRNVQKTTSNRFSVLAGK